MYCPKCGKKTEGKWCEFCGTQLEIDEIFELNPYEDTSSETLTDDENTHTLPDITDDMDNDIPYISSTENSPRLKYNHSSKNTNSDKKKIAVALSVCLVTIAVTATVLFGVLSSSNSPNEDKNPSAIEVSTTEELFDKGERYMDAGDYESAEEIFKKILDTTNDEKAAVIYKILYNYNRAILKLDDYKYREAAKFFDKIPVEYVDYVIFDDVEALGDEISRYETTYEIFENIAEFMEYGNFSAAKEAIEIMDEDALSKEDKETLKSYKEIIAENEVEEIVLSEHDAEDLLMGYCDSFVKAINSKDFEIVAPYMKKDSEIYRSQKAFIEKCIAEGITETFDSFKLISLSKTNNTTWQAKVAETETICYKNGDKETKTFNWIYTIEYIDSSFYLVGIKQ